VITKLIVYTDENIPGFASESNLYFGSGAKEEIAAWLFFK